MMSVLPITLVGNSLGKRHRQFNDAVKYAYREGEPFQAIQGLGEQSPIDRLFKIDLAAKYHNVEYLIDNLKNEDMLYVSKALKRLLLDSKHGNIMNPSYLEDTLYPEMSTTAVNKMRHWIHLNLKDHHRCGQFYLYYCEKNFDLAIKFLPQCSKPFIVIKVPDILDKLTPHYLKLLIENCPEVAKIYFDSFQNNETVLSNYLNEERKYYNALKCLLKLNADIFLDITEKYFNNDNFSALSPAATKYIMNNHKVRFYSKPELYTAWLLDLKTMAKHLSKDEIKDLILKLARAEYLVSWFSYKKVEPLIKSLSVEDRTALKKQVFVDKSFGDKVQEWPYKPPSSPEKQNSFTTHVFQDREHDPYEYEYMRESNTCDFNGLRPFGLMKCKKRSCKLLDYCEIASERKSSLEQLFDKYRFASFEHVLFELRKRMQVETAQHRQNMMLVLVSKTGARAEAIEELLRLLTTKHSNEPVHVRATVVRSLVRRASAWRLPQTSWDLFLQFSRDLGLDGKTPAAACNEGLHAVVLRNILLDSTCEPAVWSAFCKEFSTFTEYSLTAAERRNVSTKLPTLLLADANTNPAQACPRLVQLLDTLDAYKLRADQCPGIVSAIAATVRRSLDAQQLLRRLFNAGIGRRELFQENFAVIQTDASYLNALRHDTSILESGKEFQVLIEACKVNHERFLRSLALYFGEQNGLAEKYRSKLDNQVVILPINKLARPLAFLCGGNIMSMLEKFDDAPKKSEHKRFSAALRANAHLARPPLDLGPFGWRKIGVKAVANRVIKCPTIKVDGYIQELVGDRRTARLAFVLSIRVGKEASTIKIVAEKWPKLTLKTALYHQNRKQLDNCIWDIVLPLIAQIDVSEKRNERFRQALVDIEAVPSAIKPKYCAIVFENLRKISRNAAMPMLCNLENMLSDVDEEFIAKILEDVISKELPEKQPERDYSFEQCTTLYARLVTKYLLLGKCDSSQKNRIEYIGEPFFHRIEAFWKQSEKKTDVIKYLDDFILSLKYTKVFLDTKYVSCLPVFETVTKWLQRILPMEMYFTKYVQVHLTMLYFKSVRQSMINNPHVFEDLPNRLNEGAEIVGVIFGKYIAHEIVELASKYFISVIELYKTEVINYLEEYFLDSPTKTILVAALLKGVLDSEDSYSHLIAEHVFNAYRNILSDSVYDDILNILKKTKNQEVQFLLYADFYFK